MAKYNGYRNYNQWNCALWINNDEGLYHMAKDFIAFEQNRDDAARFMLEYLQCAGVDTTPDGVKWSKSCIRAAMIDL